MRVFAAKAASNASVEHRGHRIDPQRIAGRLDRQRRTARQPNARVIAGARVLVDAILDANQTLAGLLPRLGSMFVRRAAAATIEEALDGLERISG